MVVAVRPGRLTVAATVLAQLEAAEARDWQSILPSSIGGLLHCDTKPVPTVLVGEEGLEWLAAEQVEGQDTKAACYLARAAGLRSESWYAQLTYLMN